MRILITDRHTSGDEYIEKDAVGSDIELEFFDHHDDVTDEAWARADGVVTCLSLIHISAPPRPY